MQDKQQQNVIEVTYRFVGGICYFGKYKNLPPTKGNKSPLVFPLSSFVWQVMEVFLVSPELINNQKTQMIELSIIATAHWPHIATFDLTVTKPQGLHLVS
jgi:hypothetical protein